MRLATIRTQLELELADRYPRPFSSPAQTPPETILTGVGEVDRLAGGLPRGRIIEIFGPDSSGRTSLLLSTLAQVTEQEEVCGLIDPTGTFDPASAVAAGVDLASLLWVRTGRDLDLAIKATDLLVQGGGFGLIAVDLGEVSPGEVRRRPLSTWFRLQRAVENTPTILLFLGRESSIKTCASLVLRLAPDRTEWSPRLLGGIRPKAEIVRSRTNPAAGWSDAIGRFRLESASHLRSVSGHRSTTLPFQQENTQGVPSHEH